VWDPATGEPTGPAIGPMVKEHSFDLSPDGRSLVLSRTTTIYDTSTGQAIVTPNLDSELDGANFGPGGGLLVVNDAVQGHGTRIVDRTGGTLTVLPDREGYTTWMGQLSPDGRTVATIGEEDGSGSLITIWDWREGKVLRTIATGYAQGLTFDPSGDRLATFWGSVSIWTVRTGAEGATIEGGGGGIAFDADGSRLAVASRDGAIRVFDARSGRQLLTLPGDRAYPIGRIALSPDGSKLASQGPGSGIVRVWALDIDDLLQIAERNVTRSLTDAECRQYLHLETCPTR